MNSQLEAARHSSILQVADEKAISTLSYTAEKALKFPGILSQQTIKVPADAFKECVAQRTEAYVDLPKYGYLSEIVLELDCSSASDNHTGDYKRTFKSGRESFLGTTVDNTLKPYDLFEKFELKSTSGKALYTLYSAAVIEMIAARPEKYMYERALSDTTDFQAGGGAADGKARSKLFLAIPFHCFDKMSTCPDLLSLEQMQLSVTGSYADRVYDRSEFIKDMSVSVHLRYFLPTPEKHDELIRAQHPGGAAFNYISTTMFPEYVKSLVTDVDSSKSPVAWLGGPVKRNFADILDKYQSNAQYFGYMNGQYDQILRMDGVELNCAHPVKRTYIYAMHEPSGRRCVVTKLKVTDAGNILYEANHKNHIQFLSRSGDSAMTPYHSQAVRSSYQTQSELVSSMNVMGGAVIDWGMEGTFLDDENFVGSAVSFHQMSAPKIEVQCVLPKIHKNDMPVPRSNSVGDVLNALSNDWPVKTEMDKCLAGISDATVTYYSDTTSNTFTNETTSTNYNLATNTHKDKEHIHVNKMGTPIKIGDKGFIVSKDGGKESTSFTDDNFVAWEEEAALGNRRVGRYKISELAAGDQLPIKLFIVHEIMQVTTIQASANMRNRQVRVLGTR